MPVAQRQDQRRGQGQQPQGPQGQQAQRGGRKGQQGRVTPGSRNAASAGDGNGPAHMPGMVSYGSKGAEVRMLQLLLDKHGLRPGPIDGDFGPMTQKAVLKFQHEQGLAVDGVVGPLTWTELRSKGDVQVTDVSFPSDKKQKVGAPQGGAGGGKKAPGQKDPEQKSPNDNKNEAELRESILKVAGSQIGTTEQGNNAGGAKKYQQFFGRGPEPWCADFVSWVMSMAGRPTNSPYCPTFVQQLKKQGRWKGVKDPQPGDIVFFDWDGDNSPDHVGILKCVNADGSITTIEGNTSNPKNRSQEGVFEKHRGKGDIFGYGAVM
jgi:peptidoglycan hydrolase-like protein with peptidoglycan-binding domain